MKALLLLSFDQELCASGRASGLRDRATSTLRRFAGQEPRAAADGRLLAADLDGADVVEPDGRVAVLLSRTCRTTRGERFGPAQLLDRLRTQPSGSLAGIVPPFAACWRTDASSPFVAATDACGLHHLYCYQGPGWAAVSSSSLVLAMLAGEAMDPDTISTYAFAGYYLGRDTPYRNVRKLGAGTLCELAGGTLQLRRYVDDDVRSPAFSTMDEAVEQGRQALAESVLACLDAHPDPSMELSGGLDSRGVLAAVPAARRSALRAVTLGEPGAPDVVIAQRIARQIGIDHQIVDISAMRDMDPSELLASAHEASRRVDFTGDPIDLAVHNWVEARVEQVPRLTGANGEFGRGFFYPGQREHGSATDDLVAGLVRWRLFTNNAVDPAILKPEFAAAARDHATKQVRSIFGGLSGSWLRTTDEYYLAQRMQRWAGIEYTASGRTRTILAPYFDPRYLAWARRATPEQKRGDRLFTAVLAGLDRELGDVPIDIGRLTPAQLAWPRPQDRAKKAWLFMSKAAHKVRQQIGRADKATEISHVVAGHITRAWAAPPDALAALEAVEFLDHDAVRAVASDRRAVNPPTVSFLVNLQGMLDALAGG